MSNEWKTPEYYDFDKENIPYDAMVEVFLNGRAHIRHANDCGLIWDGVSAYRLLNLESKNES